MKKSNKKFEINIESFGIYTRWNRESRDLPEIVKFSNEIPAEEDAEFGMILNIKKGKGILLSCEITHPPFNGSNGKMAPPFTCEQMVTSNNYMFFIGDSIWAPVEDKKGEWCVKVMHKNEVLVQKKFMVI